MMAEPQISAIRNHKWPQEGHKMSLESMQAHNDRTTNKGHMAELAFTKGLYSPMTHRKYESF